MKKFEAVGFVSDNTIDFISKDYDKKIESFKKTSEGENITVTYEMIDTPAHFQQKFFHGYLLKDIAHAMADTDEWYVKEIVLKTRFLYQDVSNYSEIPYRFKKRARYITKFIENVECITGYIPSLGDLTYEEMAGFILKCEMVLTEDLSSYIGVKTNRNTALEFRDKAVKNDRK